MYVVIKIKVVKMYGEQQTLYLNGTPYADRAGTSSYAPSPLMGRAA